MPSLKSRQRPIPGGFRFYEESTKRKWKGPNQLTFNQLVQEVIAHRKGNAVLANKPTDENTVANEVDHFNAILAQRMGWTEYVLHDAMPGVQSSKKVTRRPSAGANAAAALKPVATVAKGAMTLTHLFGPTEKPVASEVAEKRAGICVDCDENDKGDWTRFFTEPGAAAVRKMLGFVKDANLKTSRDAKLRVCGVCKCPLKLKVHIERNFVREHTDEKTMTALPSHCWIKTGDI